MIIKIEIHFKLPSISPPIHRLNAFSKSMLIPLLPKLKCTHAQPILKICAIGVSCKFSSLPIYFKNVRYPPRPMWLIKEEEIEEKFIKGGGPGGQKINKTNSKVQLTHLPTGIVVNSQHLREQSKNREMARELLALKLEQLQDPENCRLKFIEDQKIKQRKSRLKKTNKKKKLIAQRNSETEINAGVEQIVDIEAELDMLIQKHTTKKECS